MTKLFNRVEEFVRESFIKNGKESQIKHLERTVYWIKQLNPKSDESLMVSAMSHDIERASRTKEQHQRIANVGLTHPEFFRSHEETGAKIITDFLKNEGADNKMIERVKMLISRHEEGGNEDQNLLKDADSVSFFENNVSHFLNPEKIAEIGGKNRTKAKIDWMYERITSKKAKQIVRSWYEKAIRDLETI